MALHPPLASERTVEMTGLLAALPPLQVFDSLAHAPTLFVPWLEFGAAVLANLELDPIYRELAILRVAALSGSDYEAAQHRGIASGVGALRPRGHRDVQQGRTGAGGGIGCRLG